MNDTLLDIVVRAAVVIILAFIIVEVFLYALRKIPNYQGDGLLDTLRLLLVQIQILFITLAVTASSAIAGLINNFVNGWRIYLLAGLAAGASEIWIFNSASIMSTLDQGYTEFYVPANRQVILPVTNFARVMFDTGICWYNFIFSRYRVLVSDTASIMIECAISDWQLLANALVKLATSPMKMILDFMMSGLEGNLETYQVTKAAANVIAALEPALICACEDLTFAWNITTFSLESDNLHWGIQNTTNAAIELIRVPYLILVGIFRGQFTDCADQPTIPQQIACYIVRPPNFTPVANDLCGALEDLLNWVDDVIFFLFDQFFDLSGITLPKIGPFVSQLLCVAGYLINNVLDIVFHIDLVFGPTSTLKVKYLNYVNIDTPLEHGYECASIGIPIFWNAFGTVYTDALGCVFSESANATIGVFEFATRSIIQLADEPDLLIPYVSHYNFNPINDDLQDALNCTVQFATALNKPVGDVLKYFVTADQLLINATIGAITNAITSNNFLIYLKTILAGQLDKVDEAFESMFISVGNFFRQFFLTGICPQKDPANLNAPNPGALDIFCCLGNALESIPRLIIDALQMLRNAIVAIISGESFAQVLNNALRIETKVIPQFIAADDAVSCAIATVFPTDQCPHIAFYPIRLTVRDMVKVGFNLTGIPLYFAKVAIDVIRILENGGDPAQIACIVIVGAYDVSIGNIANVVRYVARLGGCLISSGINDIGTTIWNNFGWDPGSVRDQLCVLVNFFVDVINFFANLFTNPGGPAQAIFDEIESLLLQFAASFTADIQDALTFLQNEINTIGNTIANLIHSINAIFNCIGGIFSSTVVNAMVDCFTSCFNVDDPCNNCDINYNCGTIPSVKRSTGYNSSDFVLDTTFWRGKDGNPPACQEAFMMVRKSSSEVDRYMAGMDFKRCLASAMIARMIDITLLQFNHSQPLVDPLITYDPLIGLQELYNFTMGMNTYIAYRSSSEVGNWSSYADTWDVDPVPRRVGFILDVFLTALNSENVTRSAFSSIWKMFKILFRLRDGPPPLLALPHPENDTMRFMVQPEWDQDTRDLMERDLYSLGPSPFQIFSDMWEWTSFRLKNMTTTNDTRLLKNRAGFQRVANHMTERTRHIYSTLHRNSGMYPEYTYYADEPKERQISNILCFGESCIKCQLLERLVDDYVNAILMCVEDSQTNIIVDQDEFFQSWFVNNFRKYPNTPSTSPADPAPPAVPSNTPNNLNSIVVTIFDEVIQFFLPSFRGLRVTGNDLIRFITNSNSSDPDSLFFWALFLSPFGCQYQPMTRCEVGPTGVGPVKGIEYMVLGLGIALLVSLVFAPSLTLLLFLIPLAYLFFVGIAYLMAPACVFPIPVIPNCLGDDVFGMYKNLDVDCVQWQVSFPGLTTQVCPTSTNGFKRPFVDCSEAPYSFTDGTRNLFFIMRDGKSGFLDFLSSTAIPFVRAIFGISFLNNSMTFDFSASGGVPNDTWRTCNDITIWPNLIALVAIGSLGLVIGFYTVPVFLAILLALGGLLAVLMVMLMEIISAASGGTYDRTKYFYNKNELPKERQSVQPSSETLYTKAKRVGKDFMLKIRNKKKNKDD